MALDQERHREGGHDKTTGTHEEPDRVTVHPGRLDIGPARGPSEQVGGGSWRRHRVQVRRPEGAFHLLGGVHRGASHAASCSRTRNRAVPLIWTRGWVPGRSLLRSPAASGCMPSRSGPLAASGRARPWVPRLERGDRRGGWKEFSVRADRG